MIEHTARHVVDGLREQGVDAHVAETGVNRFAVRVVLGDGREGLWGSAGAGLEAEVLLDGDLVGLVPEIAGSVDFTEAQIVDALCRADYSTPVGHERPDRPPAERALPIEGGLFRRFLGGFRSDN
ncbi:MAG: hypothetical protein M3N95_15960 [Actinomycetota bacterium]|nr:hypothetical protein [Actinomycetota bacterium]